MKPANVCKLEKGKLIDTQKGFVDTFNWMVEFLDSLTKGTAKVKDITAVVDTKYDTKTRKFTMKTRKMRAIVLDTKESKKTVFTAISHSSED